MYWEWLFLKNFNHEVNLGQSIQERNMWNLWKTAFNEVKQTITSNFLKAVFHKFNLVHSWILCPIWDVTDQWHDLFFQKISCLNFIVYLSFRYEKNLRSIWQRWEWNNYLQWADWLFGQTEYQIFPWLYTITV